MRVGPQCPELTLFINRKSFSDLLDAGADVCYYCQSIAFSVAKDGFDYTTARDWPDSES